MNGSKVSSRVENGGTVPYPPHWPLDQCLIAYQAGRCIRGTLRVLPFTPSTAATTSSFVSCDRGLHSRDICVATAWDRNRALDGDIVFVEIIDGCDEQQEGIGHDVVSEFSNIRICEDEDLGANNQAKEEGHESMWQDDPVQVDLWNPVVPIKRPRVRPSSLSFDNTTNRRREKELREQRQCKGRVVHVCPPKPVFSEMHPEKKQLPTRRIVGSLKILNNNTILLTPNNRSLPQFRCPPESTKKLIGSMQSKSDAKSNEAFNFYYQAEYVFGSWKETFNWPPCTRVKVLGEACILEDEIQALLTEYDVNHGEFSGAVLKNVNDAVQSGVFQDQDTLGWKPTPEMYKGRRDYRTTRIFTIDPTTAKDLDDALHITRLDDGTLEVGVHIADVSFFVKPETPVDKEAQLRATTVYLVDRTIPMLPRPLCEVACSLNENVERLAFSCVWRMNMDGTMVRSNNHDFVWYGRTVIKSCARLDYATAQNIIEGKVAFGEAEEDIPESLWPKSRRPVGFSIDEVAADVRLMHRVAVARRRLRFQNGAIALNGIKLTFQLDSDGRTPLLTAPYPIRDSNRLVEEMMLLANFLVAQRLITHAGDRALLRNHGDPQMEKLDDLAVLVKATLGFDLDCTTSQSLHSSLVRIGRECSDPLILQCITQLVMSPMVPADYIAAGQSEREEWRHFALNIPYYTHFTSPIRRYADVLVHRLLQATIDGPDAVDEFHMDSEAIQTACDHCNDKRMKAKNAQERCDRVFLSLFAKAHPLHSQLGIVLSVGKSAFTVFVPSLGVNTMLYLLEHNDMLTYACDEKDDGTRRILIQRKPGIPNPSWTTLDIIVMTKIQVTITCKEQPPVDVKLRLEGPFVE